MKQCQCDPRCPLEPGEDGLCAACRNNWCMHAKVKK